MPVALQTTHRQDAGGTLRNSGNRARNAGWTGGPIPANVPGMTSDIAALTSSAASHGASDLFLSAGEVPRIRVGGSIATLGESPLSEETMLAFWRQLGADPATTTDHDTSHVDADGNRFRVNLYRHLGRPAAVLRHIKSRIPELADLGLPAELLQSWMLQPSGLVLVTGATGSGKSTTLASCLDWLNAHADRHIVTIEDPVEYLFENKLSFFSQREVHVDTTSFGKGLRASLRQSPDVILVGEIRDSETATTALQAAETGHLVLSTLHSSSVTDTLERLTNLFPPEERASALLLLSSQLIGILSQKLLPAAQGGLHVIVEHLHNEGATRDWIRATALPEITDHLRKAAVPGNRSFLASLVEAVEQGQIEQSVAEQASANTTEFRRALRGIT